MGNGELCGFSLRGRKRSNRITEPHLNLSASLCILHTSASLFTKSYTLPENRKEHAKTLWAKMAREVKPQQKRVQLFFTQLVLLRMCARAVVSHLEFIAISTQMSERSGTERRSTICTAKLNQQPTLGLSL